MDPLTLALIMGGTGLVKSELIDRPKEDRQRWLAAQTQRYSPWTKLQAGPIEEADPFGSAFQGGIQGYAMGQNAEQAKAGKELMEAQKENLKARNEYLKNLKGGAANPIAFEQDAGPTMANYNKMYLSPWSYNG